MLDRTDAAPSLLPELTAAALAIQAWDVGELDRFIGDRDFGDLAAEAVALVDDELPYDTSLAVIREARRLIAVRHDGEMAAREQAEADALTDAVEADYVTADRRWS